MAVNGIEETKMETNITDLAEMLGNNGLTVDEGELDQPIDTEEVIDLMPDVQEEDEEEVEEKPKKESRAQARIRQLIEQNKQLEEQLKSKEEKPKQNIIQKPKTSEIEDLTKFKQKVLNKLSSKSLDDVFEGIDLLATKKSEAIVKDTLSTMLPIIEQLVIDKKAQDDGLDNKEIQKVFEEFPELSQLPNGYEVAKRMIKTSSTSNAKPINKAISGKSSSSGQPKSSNVISENDVKNMDPNKVRKQLLKLFKQ